MRFLFGKHRQNENRCQRGYKTINKIKKPRTRLARRGSRLEQKTGIEPAFLAWEANVLPLNYFCKTA